MPEEQIPIQPVEKPILCSPYKEPGQHWYYDRSTGIPQKRDGRRDAQCWYKTERGREVSDAGGRHRHAGGHRRPAAGQRVARGREALAGIGLGECERDDEETAQALVAPRSRGAAALLLPGRGGGDDHLSAGDSGARQETA